MEYRQEVGSGSGTLRRTCALSLAESGSVGHAVPLSLPRRLERFISALLQHEVKVVTNAGLVNRDTAGHRPERLVRDNSLDIFFIPLENKTFKER